MQLVQQTAEAPAFTDLIWSKPENKRQAGKLLIIGGNSFGFSDVGKAYEAALAAGIGEVRVLLPDVIQKIAGGVFEHAIFAPTNPSGSFAKDALPSWLEAAAWADGVLLPGDMSRNAETASVLEGFSTSYKGLLAATKDAAEVVLKHAPSALKREKTALILTMADLQLAAKQAKFNEPLTFESPTDAFVERLSQFGALQKAAFAVKRQSNVFVMSGEQISQTTNFNNQTWRVETASKAAVWYLQNPTKPFEALTSSIITS